MTKEHIDESSLAEGSPADTEIKNKGMLRKNPLLGYEWNPSADIGDLRPGMLALNNLGRRLGRSSLLRKFISWRGKQALNNNSVGGGLWRHSADNTPPNTMTTVTDFD